MQGAGGLGAPGGPCLRPEQSLAAGGVHGVSGSDRGPCAWSWRTASGKSSPPVAAPTGVGVARGGGGVWGPAASADHSWGLAQGLGQVGPELRLCRNE